MSSFVNECIVTIHSHFFIIVYHLRNKNTSIKKIVLAGKEGRTYLFLVKPSRYAVPEILPSLRKGILEKRNHLLTY